MPGFRRGANSDPLGEPWASVGTGGRGGGRTESGLGQPVTGVGAQFPDLSGLYAVPSGLVPGEPAAPGMNSCMHSKYKTKDRYTNWSEYDGGLAQRGDSIMWISPGAIQTWTAKPVLAD
ncbi:MAG: hypothetical protein ACI8QC_003604, partial [Planctomycetota bacterium]